MDKLATHLITSDPDILDGTPVFSGTQVPVSILFEYLQQSTIEEFLKDPRWREVPPRDSYLSGYARCSSMSGRTRLIGGTS